LGCSSQQSDQELANLVIRNSIYQLSNNKTELVDASPLSSSLVSDAQTFHLGSAEPLQKSLSSPERQISSSLTEGNESKMIFKIQFGDHLTKSLLSSARFLNLIIV
jgi:hypothetical protein